MQPIEIIRGSKFVGDQTDDYNYRMLSRIILLMETPCCLVLQEVDAIYGSLYGMLCHNILSANELQIY